MKIKKIIIQNYRSIKEEEIIFPKSGILALVGPNNAGKSNILKAINNILGDSWFNAERAEKNDFYLKDLNNKVYTEILFDNGSSAKIDFSGNTKWIDYSDVNGKKLYSQIKEEFPCTFLPAERSLQKNLQFRSYEIMGKIAKRFNGKAETKKVELEEKFAEIMTILDSVDGFLGFKSDFVKYFDDMQSDNPYKLKVDFKAFTPLNYFKTINILANDTSVNRAYDIDIEELGEGNKSLILFALLRSYAKNFKQEATGILAVEEPEIYLHPQARRHLFQIFKEIVSESSIQIIYTTHSPDFVSTEDFDSIGLVTKESNEGTKVKRLSKADLVSFSKQTGVPESKITEENITEFYSTTSNAKLNESFFAKKLLLVEGETEEICLPILFKIYGIDVNSNGISIIAVEGKNQIPKYWRIFKSFNIDIYTLFDSDNSNPEKVKSNENLAKCFNCTTSELTEVEDLIKVVNVHKESIFSQKLFVINKDFEACIKKDIDDYCILNFVDNKYNVFEQEAIDIIKPTPKAQKGQVARYIIKKILAEYPDYKPTFMKTLIDEMELTNESVVVTPIIENDDFLPVETQSVDYPPNVEDIPF